MTEKGGRVIINAKRFIVNMSNLIIFKFKVKNEKVMLVGKDKLKKITEFQSVASKDKLGKYSFKYFNKYFRYLTYSVILLNCHCKYFSEYFKVC